MLLAWDVLVFIVICGAAWGYGSLLVRRVARHMGPGERFYLAMNAGLGVLGLIVFALGIPHWVTQPVAWCVLAVGVALLVRVDVRRAVRSLNRGVPRRGPGMWGVRICAGVSVVALGGALSPEVRGDPIIYHVAEAMLFAVNGGHVEIRSSALTYIPQHFHMLVSLGLVLATDVTAKLLHWYCGVLLLVGAAVVTRRLGGSRTQAACAAALLALVPIWIYLATAVYVDFPVANAILCAVLLVFGNGGVSLRRGAHAGFFLGVAMGSKYTAGVVGALPLGLMLLGTAVASKEARVRRLWVVAVMALTATLTFAPWAVRNIIWTGNPVAPALMHLLGPEGVPPQTLAWPDIQAGNPGWFLQPLTWAAETFRMFVAFSDYQNFLPMLGVVLCVVALVLVRRQMVLSGAWPRGSMWLAGLLVLALVLGVPTGAVRRDARYVMAHMAILSGLVVMWHFILVGWVSERRPMLVRRLTELVVVLLFVSWCNATWHRFRDLGESLWPAWTKQSREAYQSDRLQEFRHNLDISGMVPPGDGLILGAGYPARVNYVLAGAPLTPDLFVQRPESVLPEHLEGLRRQGVRYIYGDPPAETTALLRRAGEFGGRALWEIGPPAAE